MFCVLDGAAAAGKYRVRSRAGWRGEGRGSVRRALEKGNEKERDRDVYRGRREREREWRGKEQKLAFSWLKINMHGVDSETFILPA